MSNAPTTFSAIESNGTTCLFYTLNGNILYIVSPTKEGEDYAIVPIKLDGEIITTPFARIGATASVSQEGKFGVSIEIAISQYYCSP